MKKAFTLIEIIIVVFIISILISLAMPTYKKYILKIRADEAKITILALSFAQERYKQEIGDYYPTDGSILNENIIAKNLKIDLTKSNNFIYTLSRDENDNYIIQAFLRHGKDTCSNDTDNIKCKQENSNQSDSWTNNFENDKYLEFQYPEEFSSKEYVEFGINYKNLY